MDKLREVFVITQEECAEVIQSIAKCQRFGLDAEYKNGTGTQRDSLTQEVGDLYCMLELLCEHAELDPIAVEVATENKRNKLHKWSDIFNDTVQ